MRKHLNRLFVAMVLVFTMALGNMQVFASETEPVVETITLDESLTLEYEVLADLSWKTAQDNGQWIEELGIAKDAKSLVLVINNLDKEDEDAIPGLYENQKSRLKQLAEFNKIQGKSRITYFSKGEDGEWMEIFSVECFISGGEQFDKEAIYGAYLPVSTFGNGENPGSLIPYKELTPNDYWTLNEEHESYGSIFSIEKTYTKDKDLINLEGLKSYSTYGMILHPEEEYVSCPPLIINCQQTESYDGLLSGIQMPQDQLRMMIQSIDKETRLIIADNIEDLGNM